jgi:hypothetical protein
MERRQLVLHNMTNGSDPYNHCQELPEWGFSLGVTMGVFGSIGINVRRAPLGWALRPLPTRHAACARGLLHRPPSTILARVRVWNLLDRPELTYSPHHGARKLARATV